MNPALLRAVPVDANGELQEPTQEALEAELYAMRDEVRGLQRDIRGWARRYAELQRDRAAEAESSPQWSIAIKAFRFWQRRCNHPRAQWSVDRFELVEPYLSKDGPKLVRKAIEGAEFDCFVTKRRNGTEKRHDDFSLIFRDRDHFENFVNRAPIT